MGSLLGTQERKLIKRMTNMGKEMKRIDMGSYVRDIFGKGAELLVTEDPGERSDVSLYIDVTAGVDGYIKMGGVMYPVGLRTLNWDPKYKKNSTMRIKLSSGYDSELRKYNKALRKGGLLPKWIITVLMTNGYCKDVSVIATEALVDYYKDNRTSISVLVNSTDSGNIVNYIRINWDDIKNWCEDFGDEDSVKIWSEL